MEQMNIRVELLKLQKNASLLDKAEFAAKFMTIADEYHHLQLLQQTPCTTLLPDDVRFRCTRFAHQCRLKGVVTNKDTVELYDEMFAGQ